MQVATDGHYIGIGTVWALIGLVRPARRKDLQKVVNCLQRILKYSKEMDGPEATLGATAERIDRDRYHLIRVLNGVWKTFGIEEMRLPTTINSLEEVQDPHG